MAKGTSVWKQRLDIEQKCYKEWESLFLCKILEDYYEGRQWRVLGIAPTNYKPYVLNLIYSTLKIKLANIIYQRPQYLLTAKPGHSDWDIEMSARASAIKEGTLNTLVSHPKSHFVRNVRRAALDSFFRFGIIEVNYAADWQNPIKQPIVTNADVDYEEDEKGLSLKELKVVTNEEVPVNERIFWNHIKAKRFRASCQDDPILDHSDWCGHYKYIRKSVLAKTKDIDLPTDIKNEYFSLTTGRKYKRNSDDPNYLDSNAYFKVWTIYDNIKKEKNLIIEDDNNFPIIWQAPFERLPFPNVMWDERAPSIEGTGFYPMPPVFQWISSQDEVNQTREQLRNYRKRFTRKFWANTNVKTDELLKLSNSKDGEVISLVGKAVGPDSLGQIPNPEIGITIQDSIQIASSDLNLITGTSANARQQTDRTTATESKIIDIRAQVRESVEQLDFTQFICDIGREGLLVIHERFSEDMWIKMTVDPSENFLSEIQDATSVYQYISNQEITDGSYDWDVDIDVMNATPAQMQEEKQKYFEFITVVFKMPQIALSPTLLRETAIRCGYKNERVIRELQKAATFALVQQMRQAQGQGESGGTPNNGNSDSMEGNANPNPMNEINSQMNQQLGS